MKFFIAAIFAVLAGLGALPAAAAPADQVARGRYLTIAGDCAACHTVQASAPFSGGYALHATFGTVYSSNITPDKATGIGNWTPDQFYAAMHDGIRADGKYLYPALPYPYFTHMSRADDDAIFAYLKTLKPVHYTPPPNALIFPANIRLGMAGWDALFLDKSPFRPDPAKSAQWNRGSQLVNGVAHCGGCHTAKNFVFADKSAQFLQGEVVDGWYAPDLTGTPREGLARWTAADIAQYLKTGANRFGRVTGSMREVVRLSTSQMTDDDRTAVAVYLKSLPAGPEHAAHTPSTDAMRNGRTIFVNQCSACHLEPGDIHHTDYPLLAGNSLVMAHDPTTVIRILLQGSQSAAIAHGTVGFSMPGFAALSNKDVADVATFVRNAWGNRAEPVSEKDVSSLRKTFSKD